MELKIINQKENPLFKRNEIEASIEAEVTPNKQEVKKLISEKFSIPPETIKLKGIHGKFGSKTFRVRANVYNSAEDKEKTEPKTKKEVEAEKKAAEVKAATEQAPAQEPEPTPTEKPAETQKEEPKSETAPVEKKPDVAPAQEQSEEKIEENSKEEEKPDK